MELCKKKFMCKYHRSGKYIPVIIVLLISICAIFIVTVNLTYGEEIFIFHDPKNTILWTSLEGNSIRKELNDVGKFIINRNGYFAMNEDSSGNKMWYKGRIDSELNITKQLLSSIPHDVTSVAISEDGKRVAWSTSENLQKSELTLEEYNGNESKILRKISVDGTIQAFSFSPNGDLLAYYWGPTEAITQDGFTLMLLDFKNPEKAPIEIAPPSLNPGRMNPNRSTPPLWSPTGEFILFEAEYRKAFFEGASLYIVSIDGRILEPIESGWWSQDGKYLRRIRRIGDDDSNEYIIIETDVLTRQEMEYPVGKFKIGDVNIISLSPSGRKIIYFKDNEIFVYDTMEKNTVSAGVVIPIFKGISEIFLVHGVSDFFWISPKD